MTNAIKTDLVTDYEAQGLHPLVAHLRAMNVVAVHYVALKAGRVGMIHENADGTTSKATKL